MFVVFFFKMKTADEMRIGDWSSDVWSSDLVLAAAIDGGRSVPAELSLVGFGGLAIAQHSWPRITTVSQPTIEIARIAGQRLIEGRAGDAEKEEQVITVPYDLTLRQSLGPVPG